MANKRKYATKAKPKKVELDVQLHVLANDMPPMAEELLKTLYTATFDNQIGLMYAKHVDTGAVEALLVGLHVNGDDFHVFPLAKIMNSDEAALYLAPDRMGGWQPMFHPEDEANVEPTSE